MSKGSNPCSVSEFWPWATLEGFALRVLSARKVECSVVAKSSHGYGQLPDCVRVKPKSSRKKSNRHGAPPERKGPGVGERQRQLPL